MTLSPNASFHVVPWSEATSKRQTWFPFPNAVPWGWGRDATYSGVTYICGLWFTQSMLNLPLAIAAQLPHWTPASIHQAPGPLTGLVHRYLHDQSCVLRIDWQVAIIRHWYSKAEILTFATPFLLYLSTSLNLITEKRRYIRVKGISCSIHGWDFPSEWPHIIATMSILVSDPITRSHDSVGKIWPTRQTQYYAGGQHTPGTPYTSRDRAQEHDLAWRRFSFLFCSPHWTWYTWNLPEWSDIPRGRNRARKIHELLQNSLFGEKIACPIREGILTRE